MKRRSFFKTLFGAVASIALAQKIALEPIKLAANEPKWIPNPAYENAVFEASYIWHPDVFATLAENGDEIAIKSTAFGKEIEDSPKRYVFVDGDFLEVDPRILMP